MKNPTVNYPRDSHAVFCKRCKQHNKGCPLTKSGTPTKSCSL